MITLIEGINTNYIYICIWRDYAAACAGSAEVAGDNVSLHHRRSSSRSCVKQAELVSLVVRKYTLTFPWAGNGSLRVRHRDCQRHITKASDDRLFTVFWSSTWREECTSVICTYQGGLREALTINCHLHRNPTVRDLIMRHDGNASENNQQT